MGWDPPSSATAHHWRRGYSLSRAPLPLPRAQCTLGFILRAVTPIHLVAHPTRRVRHQFWGCQLRSTVMDYFKIPYFAMFRQTGTVIVRLRMEIPDSCCKPGTISGTSYPRTVYRTSSCEGCSRTRSNSQYCDCDSDLVDRCQPYRASSARSSKLNILFNFIN